jgi:hypothetical protein
VIRADGDRHSRRRGDEDTADPIAVRHDPHLEIGEMEGFAHVRQRRRAAAGRAGAAAWIAAAIAARSASSFAEHP